MCIRKVAVGVVVGPDAARNPWSVVPTGYVGDRVDVAGRVGHIDRPAGADLHGDGVGDGLPGRPVEARHVGLGLSCWRDRQEPRRRRAGYGHVGYNGIRTRRHATDAGDLQFLESVESGEAPCETAPNRKKTVPNRITVWYGLRLPQDFTPLVELLRRAGGDTADVEVKAAAGGLPASLTETLCALANLPGGGTVLLGIDEHMGFAPVALADPQVLKQGLASKARGFVPPVQLDIIDEATVDGQPVVAAIVRECDVSASHAAWRRLARPTCGATTATSSSATRRSEASCPDAPSRTSIECLSSVQPSVISTLN